LTKRLISDPDATKLHSLYVHYNKTWKHANNIFGRNENSWKCLYGPSAIEETLPIPSNDNKIPLFFPPNVFRQANQKSFSRIIDNVRTHCQTNNIKFDNCLELYGGVGTIGLNLADLVTNSLVCSDENPYNVDQFEKSKKRLPKNLRKKVSYAGFSAEDCCKNKTLLNEQVDLVVVDPPRKGLDSVVLTALNNKKLSNLKTLVYISCGFDAFTNDCAKLETEGGWKIEKAEGHVLFPGADAIETLAIFTR